MKPRHLAVYLLLALTTTLCSQAREEVIFKKIKGKGGDLKLHVFYPADFDKGQSKPCIVFFFGGGWNGGSPSQFYSQSEYLASRGMVAISAQYRTKSSHGAIPKQCVEDGRSAIRYVRQHAKELGIDPNKIAAGGGSAGGHVAAATGVIDKFDNPTENKGISAMPNALVLFNPVYDNGPKGYGHSRVKDYYQDISPLHNIKKGMPPTLTMMGDKDALTPPETCHAYKKKMEAVGVRSELILFKDQGHGFFNLSKGGPRMFCGTVNAMDKFLTSLGYLTGEANAEAWLATQKKTKKPKKK